MEREILIIDKTSGSSVTLLMDDQTEYLQVWGLEHDNEKIIAVERRIHGHKKPPFVVMPSLEERIEKEIKKFK